jgi:hydrogenase nickel incorporation protein HypA/HybF
VLFCSRGYAVRAGPLVATMHEYSLVLSLIERVEQEMKTHHATMAHRIKVSVGELSGVEAELLASAYEIARESSMLKATELIVARVAARWCCSSCNREVDSRRSLLCDTCGGQAKLVEGGDILFESVELEIASD